ncbi:hypothetical protein D3C85_1626520 [compost metagenome]
MPVQLADNVLVGPHPVHPLVHTAQGLRREGFQTYEQVQAACCAGFGQQVIVVAVSQGHLGRPFFTQWP